MAAKLTAYHVRGLNDSAGSPGTTIATVAVEHWDDGTIRYTRANGRPVVVRGPGAQKLLADILGITLVGDN